MPTTSGTSKHGITLGAGGGGLPLPVVCSFHTGDHRAARANHDVISSGNVGSGLVNAGHMGASGNEDGGVDHDDIGPCRPAWCPASLGRMRPGAWRVRGEI